MTRSSDYLWQQLGVAPTTDEAAIRRAYARRLRDVRPDDNPEGFQQLVEARDLALRLAQRGTGSETERWELTDELAAESEGRAQVEDIGIRPARSAIDPLAATDARHDGREPAAILDLLDAVLREASDAGTHCPAWLIRRAQALDAVPRQPSGGWQQIADRIASLSIPDRTAIQPDLI